MDRAPLIGAGGGTVTDAHRGAGALEACVEGADDTVEPSRRSLGVGHRVVVGAGLGVGLIVLGPAVELGAAG